MKQISLGLAVILFTGSAVAVSATEEATVREATRTVLEQLNLNRDNLEKEPAYIQHLVRELIVPHFDFEQMSQLVLGKYWPAIETAGQTCFASGFRDLLVERYAYILLSYDNHQLSYEAGREVGEKGYRVVKQTISRDGMEPLPIEYAMQRSGDTWKVVDLIIDGVSLVRNYRGIFQSRIHTQGLEYFLGNFPGCINQSSEQ